LEALNFEELEKPNFWSSKGYYRKFILIKTEFFLFEKSWVFKHVECNNRTIKQGYLTEKFTLFKIW